MLTGKPLFRWGNVIHQLDLMTDLLGTPPSPVESTGRGFVAGYRSVLRTFISAFIASYEINIQLEDSTLNLILDILCKVYRGEVWLHNDCLSGNHFAVSFGTKKVLLMVLFGVFFVVLKVNFPSGLWNLFASYHPYLKELGQQNV
ncbi:uncharacterized protein LOC133791889 [Humulus lupulus]|uniref:uncharacterized protein LOC133791889 n=1 Tax=Humulus lupulus TaxID=3486 RepID=UPI002B40D22D|nr:uncharacterized protein LOC133791889 [Humulus lupulus]